MSDPKDEYATVGRSFITDQKSVLLLKTLLPAGWLWRRQTPDFFVDYEIEVAERGELTGLHFGVQIKGRGTASQNSQLRRRMATKHLAYYRDKARLPVFVALVNTQEASAHWLFTQKYLRENVSRSDVDNQKTLTLRFDPLDSFSDLERFHRALQMADEYMRELYPGSPGAAISKRKQELQALDPDVDVEVAFDNGEEIRFHSKKPLVLRLRGRDANGFQSYQAMLDHGEDFIAEVDVEPPESPLFQTLMMGGKKIIKFTPSGCDGTVQISCGTSVETVIQVEGHWRGGAKSVRFDGALENSPLAIHIRTDDFLSDKAKTSFSTPVCLAEWEGQPISCLAWFEEIHSFITALATNQELRVKYFMNGVNVGGFTATATTSSEVDWMKNMLDWLARARSIATHYGSYATLPNLAKIGANMQSTVDALWALTNGSASEESIAGVPFLIRTAPDINLSQHSGPSAEPITGAMKLVGTATFDFFGQAIVVPNIEEVFSDMELVDIKADPAAKWLTFRGRDGATLARRKVA